MNKNVKQLTTRESMSPIESNNLSNNQKLPQTSRKIIEHKWLLPQLKALFLHQYNKTNSSNKIKTIKDMYIDNLHILFKQKSSMIKYYPMNQTFKTSFKSIIRHALMKHQAKPVVKSSIYRFVLAKILRINKERQIQGYNSKNIKIKSKKSQDKIEYRSPVVSKKASVEKLQQKNRNLLGVATQRKVFTKEQNYGLKNYLNKISIKPKVSLKEKPKAQRQKSTFQKEKLMSKQKKFPQASDYNINAYSIKQNSRGFAKPQSKKKSLSNSRFLLQKNSQGKNLKIKTQRSNGSARQKKSMRKQRV